MLRGPEPDVQTLVFLFLEPNAMKYKRIKRHSSKIKAVVKMTPLPGDQSVDLKRSKMPADLVGKTAWRPEGIMGCMTFH